MEPIEPNQTTAFKPQALAEHSISSSWGSNLVKLCVQNTSDASYRQSTLDIRRFLVHLYLLFDGQLPPEIQRSVDEILTLVDRQLKGRQTKRSSQR